LTAEYEYRTKLFGNVSLVVDFSASSGERRPDPG
jgi:hypothetical protein